MAALQAPPADRKTARRWGVYTTDKSHAKGFPERCRKEERDPQLPTSVPMPSAVDDITDAGMRAMWETDGSRDAASATVPVTVSWGGAAEEVVEARVA